ncbi:hypothetical protein, partial [Oceanihabitans sediminis]
MKKRFLKTILPVLLLVSAVFIIGSGCHGDPNDYSYNFWPDLDQDGFGDANVNGTMYRTEDAPA